VSGFGLLLGRELRLALRNLGDSATVVLFFVVTASLFPFGIGPGAEGLARIAPGVIWVTALLACLLSLDRLFALDAEDGSLELLALSPTPLVLVVLAKTAAHWLTTGVPLVVAAPVLAILFGLHPDAMPVLVLALLLGTPVLSLLGAAGAALAQGARRGGVLVPLIALPLTVPVLIFGVAAVEAAAAGLSPRPHLLLLAALLCATAALAPWAAAAALRQALE